MAASGQFLNFDKENAVTANPEDVGDPFHANERVLRDVTSVIVQEMKGDQAPLTAPLESLGASK